MGKKDEVNEIIDKQIEENTDDYIPYLIKGNILKEENKLEDTIEQYKNCIKYKKIVMKHFIIWLCAKQNLIKMMKH